MKGHDLFLDKTFSAIYFDGSVVLFRFFIDVCSILQITSVKIRVIRHFNQNILQKTCCQGKNYAPHMIKKGVVLHGVIRIMTNQYFQKVN